MRDLGRTSAAIRAPRRDRADESAIDDQANLADTAIEQKSAQTFDGIRAGRPRAERHISGACGVE